jgi:hypothetical protein
VRRMLLSIAIALLAVSCAPGAVDTTTSAPPPTVTAAPTSGAPSTTSTTGAATSTTRTAAPEAETPIYLFFEGYPIAPGPYLAAAARTGVDELADVLGALLEGAHPDEIEAGLSSTIPRGTRLLGVAVSDGVAFVDLSLEFGSGGGSLSMMGRVAQVVYTATQFEGVDAVRFLVEGVPLDVLGGEGLIIDTPQTRGDWVDLTPPIMIEEPSWGSVVGPDITFSGTAIVESGEISYVIVDADGLIIHEATAATPSGVRGAFTDRVVLDEIPHPGQGSIIAWEWAPDGSQRHVLEYPLTLGS